jgi:hypothetical protein
VAIASTSADATTADAPVLALAILELCYQPRRASSEILEQPKHVGLVFLHPPDVGDVVA